MLKRIFCIVLSFVTIFSCCGLSCVYGVVSQEKVTSKGYKWTLYTDQILFQEALLRSSQGEGLTGDNVTINDLKDHCKASDQSGKDEGYGMVMFVAEYTDKDGNTCYAYLSGDDNEIDIRAQGRKMSGQKLKNAYSLDGFEPGASEFFTTTAPCLPWVKTMYVEEEDRQKIGNWVGSKYAIRVGDSSNKPGKYFLTTLENIYAQEAQMGHLQIRNYDGSTYRNFHVGNGLSYKYKNTSGVYGSKNVEKYGYGDLYGETRTDYFYICFGGNGNSGTQQATIGSKKAAIKSFNDGIFERDPNNKKNVKWSSIYDNKTKNFAGYTRSWSVTENNGSPVLFSSIYFDDNDQYRIADSLIKIRNADIGNVGMNVFKYYIEGDITEADLQKMSDDHLFNFEGSGVLKRAREWKMSIITHDETYEYFREHPGYVSSFGTDKDKSATMTGFYVYVGEQCELTTTKTIETVENGQSRTMSSRQQIAADTTITVNEGGTLIIDGTVFCYGKIKLNGGTMIVKGQLLNTYPETGGYHFGVSSINEKKNSATIEAEKGTIIVLDDALINLELCYSNITLQKQSSMYIYGMVCNNGDEYIYDSNVVLGNEGVFVHGGTLRTGENYQNYTRGGLNKMQSSANASKTLYSDIFRDATPFKSERDSIFSVSRSNFDIKGDLIMVEKLSNKDNMTTDIKQYYKSIIQ